MTVNKQGVKVGAGFSRKVCSQDGWCWENPLPHGHTMNALWGTSAQDIWAVGDAGIVGVPVD